MSTVGETSGAREEVFTDIPVISEQLAGYAPVAPATPPSESESESEEDPAEVEIGGAAEETPEEGSPVFHTFQDDRLGDFADRIIEQEEIIEEREARIAHLEEQNALHQEREEQYKAEAYQRQSEVMELKAQIHTLESSAPQLGATVQQLMSQNSQLRLALEHSQARGGELQTALQSVRAERDWERADGVRLQEFWARAATRVDVLEREARDRSARIDTLEHAMNTAFHRLRDRVRRYPREEGSSRQVIRRRVVDRLARQAFRRAIRHSRH